MAQREYDNPTEAIRAARATLRHGQYACGRMYHDAWCPTIQTQRAEDCTCRPYVRLTGDGFTLIERPEGGW